MARSLKTCVACGVHVQQVTRARPLIATHGISGRTRPAREPVAVKHLPDRRVWMTCLSSDQPRPPAGAPARLADPLLSRPIKEPRRAMRATAAIDRPRQRMSLLRRSDAISMPPAMGCRRRDAQRRRCLPERASLLDCLAQRQASCRSELRSTVDLHPGPPRK